MTKGTWNVIHRRNLFALVLAALPLASGDVWAAEPKWPKEPYRYLVIDQDLREVLQEFGRNVRLPVRLSDNISRRRVRGDLAVAPPREFLQRLCESYGLVWYYDGALLHISDENEVRTELLNTGSVDPQVFLGKLQALGVADPRFPIQAGGGGAVISVAGPPPYVALVRKTVEAMERSTVPRPVQEVTNGDTLKVRVFRGSRQGS